MKNKIMIFLLMCFSSFATASNIKEPKKLQWRFEGIFGSFDRQAAQRGSQIYFEVCSACHSLKHLYYRNLKDIGFSEEEVKAIASQYIVIDGPDDNGEMFERSALPSDNFVSPYPNEEIARASNNGAYPVDLSLIVKARKGGADYLYSILTGYQQAPEGSELMDGLYYNPYFEDMQIAMPPPLMKNQIEYLDGTNATIEQMSRDVSVFLQWAAEPEMERRKSMGMKVFIFLSIFTILFFFLNRKIWQRIKK